MDVPNCLASRWHRLPMLSIKIHLSMIIAANLLPFRIFRGGKARLRIAGVCFMGIFTFYGIRNLRLAKCCNKQMRIARVSGWRFRSYSLAKETRQRCQAYLIVFLLVCWTYKTCFIHVMPLVFSSPPCQRKRNNYSKIRRNKRQQPRRRRQMTNNRPFPAPQHVHKLFKPIVRLYDKPLGSRSLLSPITSMALA